MFIEITNNGELRLICSEKSWNILEKLILEYIEYNTDTSAGHPIKDDDIVRYSEETQRVQDKELEHNI